MFLAKRKAPPELCLNRDLRPQQSEDHTIGDRVGVVDGLYRQSGGHSIGVFALRSMNHRIPSLILPKRNRVSKLVLAIYQTYLIEILYTNL